MNVQPPQGTELREPVLADRAVGVEEAASAPPLDELGVELLRESGRQSLPSPRATSGRYAASLSSGASASRAASSQV